MKQNLRFLLSEPFGGLKKNSLDELEKVVKDFSVSFSLFCAENFNKLRKDTYWCYNLKREFTTEELYDKFIENYDTNNI